MQSDPTPETPPPGPALLACPFCGIVPEAIALRGAGHAVGCESDACPLWLVDTLTYHTPELAAAAWNTRAPAAASG